MNQRQPVFIAWVVITTPRVRELYFEARLLRSRSRATSTRSQPSSLYMSLARRRAAGLSSDTAATGAAATAGGGSAFDGIRASLTRLLAWSPGWSRGVGGEEYVDVNSDVADPLLLQSEAAGLSCSYRGRAGVGVFSNPISAGKGVAWAERGSGSSVAAASQPSFDRDSAGIRSSSGGVGGGSGGLETPERIRSSSIGSSRASELMRSSLLSY